MLSTVGEEVESVVSNEEEEEDEDLDDIRESVVAARISREDLTSMDVLIVKSDSFEKSKQDEISPTTKLKNLKSKNIPKMELEFKKQIVYPSSHTSLKEKRISALKIVKPTIVSALSQMVDSSQDVNNPFARDYSFFVRFSLFKTISFNIQCILGR